MAKKQISLIVGYMRGERAETGIVQYYRGTARELEVDMRGFASAVAYSGMTSSTVEWGLDENMCVSFLKARYEL